MSSDFDAVLVPGGGVRPGGELPPWIAARCDRAADLAGQAPIILLSAGTLHKPPPLNEARFPWLECSAGAKYLLGKGIEPSRLWTESSSYDTIGNAYFCRVIHTDPLNLRKLLVVNSAFHMPRTVAIFDWVFGLPNLFDETKPSHISKHLERPYLIVYESTDNVGLSSEAVRAREEKESAGIAALRKLVARVGTLQELHRFLYSEHAAYVAGGVLRTPVPTPVGAVETY